MSSVFCEPVAKRTDWETPQWLFDQLDQEFHFDLDVCATQQNRKCIDFIGPDSLVRTWFGTCWMNPPYGQEIGEWIKLAYDYAAAGKGTVVCLLPVRSNNAWWRYVIEGEVRFLRKKVRFVDAPSESMFPNVVVVFRPGLAGGGRMSIMERERTCVS